MTLGRYDCPQAVEAEMVTPGRLARFSTQALANSLWAFATLRFYPSRFLQVSLGEVCMLFKLLQHSLLHFVLRLPQSSSAQVVGLKDEQTRVKFRYP